MAEINNGKPLTLAEIQVEGFKSLRDRVSVALGPLTILAGANSSGKSSLMQPLLLLKQTYDPAYDPGPLWLGGPNVIFSDVEQLFWIAAEEKSFTVALTSPTLGAEITFLANGKLSETYPLSIARCVWRDARRNMERVTLTPGMSAFELQRVFAIDQGTYSEELWRADLTQVIRSRASLIPVDKQENRIAKGPWNDFPRLLQRLIHVPGLRGNPERTYKRISSEIFAGVFQDYTASVIFRWQQENADALLALGQEMLALGLTAKVDVRALSATELELRVGRLRDTVTQDMVSIADVGFGVSQVLPVVVALLAAKPGQLVYLEQPEIHLHPRAQVALAEVIARAVNRGVQVIVETHSELLLLGIQSLVAREKLSPDRVKLHWFTRDEEGVTRVTSADLDQEGAFGDWPVDFADVSMSAMRTYMNAVAARLRGER